MGKTNLELVEFVKTKLGTAYVYGMKGDVLTQSMFDYLQNAYGSSYVWDSDASKIGKICVDCSGLISWCTGIVRGSTQFKTLATVQPMSTVLSAPKGVAVWRSGHIGVYIGDGKVIEAKGSAYGTVETEVDAGGWTYWFEITDIDYVEEVEEEEEEEEMRYNTVAELPDWAQEVINSFVEAGKIADGNNLDLSMDMIRLLVIMSR